MTIAMLTQTHISDLVAAAIAEDVGSGDLTASLLPRQQGTAIIITREPAILCGQAWVNEVYRQLSSDVSIDWLAADGQAVIPGQTICTLKGDNRELLTGERISLNFLQMLSGTATTTQNYVELLKGTQTRLLDTRKTIPGFRLAQKYAVTCGGGYNHRMGLYDAYLIKENHITACGSITSAISKARAAAPDKKVEVEVETLQELEEAISCKADIIMLDNFDLSGMKQAVEINAGRAKLEVSGNVTRETLPAIAAIGIDYISVGALTKHVRAIDLSFRLLDS